MKRRSLITAFGAAAMAGGTAWAQTSARVISGYPPGGAVDQLARVFAEEFGKSMGKTYIVDTRTGAGGQIAVDALKAAAPDGNSVLIAAASNITIYPHTVRKPTYELKDFIPVAIAGEYDTGLAVSANGGPADLKSFIVQAKSNPDRATYATPGAGSMPHFYGVLLAQTTGVPFRHVPYRGTGPAINDAIAGHVGCVISPLGTLAPQAKGGKLKLLATTGRRRSRQAPDVPTFQELGFPQLESSTWFGVFVPAGTSADVVARLNATTQKAMQNPAIRDRFIALDLEPREMSQPEFAALVKTESEHWANVVKASGFVADGQ
jgi:tripartite-type tricarboxylate transporter receptor subunit TctC